MNCNITTLSLLAVFGDGFFYEVVVDVCFVGEGVGYFLVLVMGDGEEEVGDAGLHGRELSLVGHVVYFPRFQACLDAFFLLSDGVDFLGDIGAEGFAVGVYLAYFLDVVSCQRAFIFLAPCVALLAYLLYALVEFVYLALHEDGVEGQPAVGVAVVFLVEDV